MYVCVSFTVPGYTTNANCSVCASVYTYPQLASLTSDDGLLTQLIFNQLLGTDLNLSTLNWMGLTQNTFNMEFLILQLASDLDVSSPQAVLEEDITINQLISALASVAENEGTLLALNQILGATLPTGTFQLGDMLDINTIDESLADINLDFFSFLNTAIQLYNYENVLVTNDPIDIKIPILGDVSLQAQVVEPPNIVCANSSTQLFSAGIRLKLDVDIVDIGVNLDVAVLGADVDLTLAELELYLDIASGLTTITSVNGVDGEIDINSTPGLARVFLGSISESDFFDRTQDPIEELDYGTIGGLNIQVSFINVPFAVEIKATATASSAYEAINDVMLPFNITLGNSSATVSELVDDLLADTDIRITSNSPLVDVVSGVVDIVLDDVISNVSTLLFAQNGIIHDIFGSAVDPILGSLGVRIGEVIIAGQNIVETCFDLGDAPNSYSTLFDVDGPRHVLDDLLYLGLLKPQSETDGKPDNNAGLEMEDDGISVFPYLTIPGEYSVEVLVTNLSSDSAQVVGWIDFNGNGIFENNYERSIVTTNANVNAFDSESADRNTNVAEVRSETEAVMLTWENLPLDADPNLKYARLRLTSDPKFFVPALVTPGGFAMDGEVEDYLISQSILPVDFISLELEDLGKEVSVEWKVANEINLDKYVIEKSYDGINFDRVYEQNPKLQEGSIQTYKYYDTEESKGHIFYRIRSVDQDGKQSISKIKSLSRGDSKHQLEVYPNPFSNQVSVSISNEDNVEIEVEIRNAQQQLIFKSKITSESNTLNIDMSDFPSGVYNITTYNNQSINSKLIIKS